MIDGGGETKLTQVGEVAAGAGVEIRLPGGGLLPAAGFDQLDRPRPIGQQLPDAAPLQHRRGDPRGVGLVVAGLDEAFHFLCLHRPHYRPGTGDP